MELPGQLSPELVLVDPELALWARARLTVAPRPALVVAPRPVEALPASSPVVVARHGALERVLLAGIVVLALVIAFGLARHEWHYAAAVALPFAGG